ncbi:MAG: beta-L-arabinofuranosidase domain-containing protein [Bacteroidota bacterium]
MVKQYLLSVLLGGIILSSGYSQTNSVVSSTAMKVNYGRPFETKVLPAFIPLPPGSVEPQGWLRDWCLTAKEGYTGHMDEVDIAFRQAWAADYTMNGERLDWPQGGWPYEGGGYWFDGMIRLGYVLHDESLIRQAKQRLDVVVTHMNSNSILFMWWLNKNNPGDLSAARGDTKYPLPAETIEWPFWANGLLGRSLVAYYAGSGDKHVLEALETAYSGDPDWLRMGWGMSNPWPALETYTWTGNQEIAAGLTRLFSKDGGGANSQRDSWNRYSRMPNQEPGAEEKDHGVHFLESTTPWALGYLWTGNREFLEAAIGWSDLLEREAMQPYGVLVADEFCGPAGAYRGTETCDVSAYLWSQTELLRITGQGARADRVEQAFFNAAPAVVSRDFTSHVYTQMPNRIVPGENGYNYQKKQWPLCCTASLNRMLPNYVVNMWMATYDNGLAATFYGPCKVSALVSDHISVELNCQTDYPFNDVIDISVKPMHKATFPLSFRIPDWCTNPTIWVNGSVVEMEPDTNGFVRIERRWKANDRIRIQFPMSVRIETGQDLNADGAPYASVHYGPLLFALPIPWTTDENTPDSTATWHYALDSQGELPGSDITVVRKPMPARWNWPAESPIQLQVNVVSFDWDGTVLPAKPVANNGSLAKKTRLIPYGCTQFRVSMFPVTERTFSLADLEKAF